MTLRFVFPHRARLASLVAIALAASASGLGAQAMDPATCPMHAEHMKAAQHDHGAEVDRRGDQVMGFSHQATTHHFVLLADGGAIEISANDPKDTTSLDAVRSHLTAVAAAFARGDYSMPKAIHGEEPPGAGVLTAQPADLETRYEETPAGARVRLIAKTPAALTAVHDFLRYQITEHRTGDPLEPAG